MLLVQLHGHCFALRRAGLHKAKFDLLVSRVTVTVLVTATDHLEMLWCQ